MDNRKLTHAQNESTQILDYYILDPHVLLRHCALIHGDYSFTKAFSLGALGIIPLELRHEILSHLELASLLDYQRVNKEALQAVGSMIEYEKITENAPSTIRMAIGIETAHTFTIRQLFQKLCQKTCDGACGRLAPYVDMFRLTRTCLEVGGLPRCEDAYRYALHTDIPGISPQDFDSFRGFIAIPGSYGQIWNRISASRQRLFEKQDLLDMAMERDIAVHHSRLPGNALAIGNKLTAVFAPRLAEQDTTAECGVFCVLCRESEMRWVVRNPLDCRSKCAIPMSDWGGEHIERPSPILMAFYTVEQSEEHKERVHGILRWDTGETRSREVTSINAPGSSDEVIEPVDGNELMEDDEVYNNFGCGPR